jgi:hypothetical protein
MEDTENVLNEEQTTEEQTTEETTAEAETEVTEESSDGEAEAETEEETETDTGTDDEEEDESIWDRLAKALEDPEDESAEADTDTDTETDTETEEGGADTSEEADADTDESAGEEDEAEYTSAADDIATINERFGTAYTSIEQIPNHERFAELRAMSLSAEEAYGAVSIAKRKAVPPSKAHQTPAAPSRKAPKPSATETEIRDTAELLGVSRAEALKYIERAKRLKINN